MAAGEAVWIGLFATEEPEEPVAPLVLAETACKSATSKNQHYHLIRHDIPLADVVNKPPGSSDYDPGIPA